MDKRSVMSFNPVAPALCRVRALHRDRGDLTGVVLQVEAGYRFCASPCPRPAALAWEECWAECRQKLVARSCRAPTAAGVNGPYFRRAVRLWTSPRVVSSIPTGPTKRA